MHPRMPSHLETCVMHPMPESLFDNAVLHLGPVVAAYGVGLLMLLLAYARG